MDTNARRRRAYRPVESPESALYNHDVSLYKEPPKVQVSLAEFEELAIERLKLLRVIEQASLKGPKIYSDEWKALIKEDLLKENLKKYVRLMSGYCGQTEADIQARRADHISHYIFRLAYCRSEELRRWFLNRELEWFKLRFMVQSSQSVLNFLSINNLTYKPISHEEKENFKPYLMASTPMMSDATCNNTEFYKVYFTEVFPLVKSRRVYLKSGFAYIPMSDLVVCIQSKYRATLNESLSYFNQKLPTLDDERLNDILPNLHNAHTGKSYVYDVGNKEAVDPADLDDFSKKHYPLCMRNIHETLRKNHHLKHQSRLQYGLFLKGIGVLYEHAVQFWRQEFTQIMDSNKFDKSYLYNISHAYGKVGNMVNYSPYSCIKIIMGNVGAGECNGCPFKHWDPPVLKSRMHELGLNTEGVEQVMDLVTNHHYQIACTKYFEHTHCKPPVQTINHPNQYFEESKNIDKEKAEAKKK